MKRLYILGAFLLIFPAFYSLANENETDEHHDHQHANESENSKDTPANLDTASHSLGILYGLRADGNFEKIDYEQFINGFKNAFESELNQEQIQQADTIVSEYLKTTQAARASVNLQKSKTFLEENAKKEGVIVTESGLQYEILKQGKGKHPNISDQVTVHYRGTLMDGKEFDSSYSRDQPASFQLGSVIKGWTEGLQLMQEGANYKFTIPPELAYGERGAGAAIGPNEALIFEVDLIKVEESTMGDAATTNSQQTNQ